MSDSLLHTNPVALPLVDVPCLPLAPFQAAVVDAVKNGGRLCCLCADQDANLYAVVAEDAAHGLRVYRCRLAGERFPSITPVCPSAHVFEREIAEQYGLVAEGHPWFKPVRFHRSWRPGVDAWERAFDHERLPHVEPMFRVEGEEIHEVAVGPVHAGVIEPGHFRFQCHGETVFHLEIVLGYQHRGVERALEGGPDKRTLSRVETMAGDTTIGHTWAWCQAVEALAGVTVTPRAHAIRAVALELERLANHTGDLGALANDVGFLPTASFNGRIRGDWLNMSAVVCGSRLGRGLVVPGGVRFDVDEARKQELLKRLKSTARDTAGACNLLLSTPSVQARFEGVGVVHTEDARAMGLVGMARRACGDPLDVRCDHPYGYYSHNMITPAQYGSGDVDARARVRWHEIEESCELIQHALTTLPEGEPKTTVGPLKPNHLAVSLVEGWRGEIVHLLVTDEAGRIRRAKIVDPSFHNWFGLALALRSEQISDFPLCNKSFNLSYCGHDL